MTNQLFDHSFSEILKAQNVNAAYLFGSQNSDHVNEESDFDVALVVQDKTKINYREILRLLLKICEYPEKLHLSIVDLKNSAPVFLFQVIKNGTLLYEDDTKKRVDIEAKIMDFYYDDQYRENIYYQYLKQKYADK